MNERKMLPQQYSDFKHVKPLNLQAGTLKPRPEVPIAACDCDGYCDHTNVCVVGDIPVDVDACGIWG